MKNMNFKYIVKPENRVVICILITKYGDRYRGIAKCSPEDTFQEELGKEIARKRAIIKFKKAWIEDLKSYNKDLKKDMENILIIANRNHKQIIKLNESIGCLEAEIDNVIEFFGEEV